MINVRGTTALVTGAGSGIGRAIAVSLAQRGGNLALVDINGAGLAQTLALLHRFEVRTTLHQVDIADADAVAALPATVANAHGHIDILVNGAGVALGGTFEQIAPEDFAWLFGINFWGPVRLTRACLPHLRARPAAQIVMLSSLFGLVAPAGQSAYSASKFALRGFGQSLAAELRRTSIGVTMVHPGGVATGIARNARAPRGVSAQESERELQRVQRLLKMPASQAGEIIVKAIERRAPRVIVGSDAKLVAAIERLFPVSYHAVLRRLGAR